MTKELGRLDEAIELFDRAIERTSGERHPAIRTEWARALVDKADILVDVGREQEAFVIIGDVLREFAGDRSNLAIQDEITRATELKGYTLAWSGRCDEARAFRDEIATCYGVILGAAVTTAVMNGLYNRAEELSTANHGVEALELIRNVRTALKIFNQ